MDLGQTTPVEVLVHEFLAGRQQVAAELLERYGNMAYSVISHLLLRHEDADDVYQEACIKAFSSLHSLKDSARFGAWFKQIAIRTAIDYARKRRIPQAPLDEQLPDSGPGPELSLLETAEGQELRRAVAELPEHYRRVIVLYYWSDCSYQEIADALRIPKGTVMSRLHKAKTLLLQGLEPKQAEEGKALWI